MYVYDKKIVATESSICFAKQQASRGSGGSSLRSLSYCTWSMISMTGHFRRKRERSKTSKTPREDTTQLNEIKRVRRGMLVASLKTRRGSLSFSLSLRLPYVCPSLTQKLRIYTGRLRPHAPHLGACIMTVFNSIKFVVVSIS